MTNFLETQDVFQVLPRTIRPLHEFGGNVMTVAGTSTYGALTVAIR